MLNKLLLVHLRYRNLSKLHKKKEEYIWHQFRLSLDGKRMCDGCHSFITSDVPPIYERKNKADFLVGFLEEENIMRK